MSQPHRRCGSQTNKYDFNSFANVKNDRDESQMASGRLFQVRGPVMANDQSPSLRTRHVELPTVS